MEEVRDVKLKKGMTLDELIDVYREIHGFMASHLVKAVEILKKMMLEADVKILTFTANLVATGLRGVLAQLIESRKFNVVITTAGAIDHDIARSFGGKYLKGEFDVDDSELYQRGIHRLGNVFIPITSYGPIIEQKLFALLDEILQANNEKNSWGIREILQEIGKRIQDQNSILRAAAAANVPIFVPGFLDGAFGTSLFIYSRFRKLVVDVFKDEQELADIISHSKKLGALIIGGGISKHHAIWWAQFREGLDYVVYITTAVEWDGSLSGARPKEAISWGKVRRDAYKVVVYADATLVLPIIAYHIMFST